MAIGDEEDEKSRDQQKQISQKSKTPIVIGVPSYQDVLDSSQTKSTAPSLFKPSQTFSQAFAFVKSSEFYSPPPLPSSATSSSSGANLPCSSQLPSSSQTAQADVVSCSSSLASVSASSAGTGALPSNSTQSRNAILVGNRQKGNPLLKHIRNVRWAFSDIIPDYLLGQSSCALYLSLRYHLLHPDYLYYRIRELQKNYKLRVVLCHIDVEDVIKPLLEVTKTALLHDCTLLCGWSLAECARYLETIKVYENKPADLIQGQMDTDYLSRLNHALTTVRHVNKTDVITLGSTFGSLSHIMDASMEDLARCPGIGERKVKRLYDTFHEPFKRATSGHPPVPEASNPETSARTGKNLEETARDDDFTEDSNKHQKKEPEKTVKSALSAVFARYSDKLGKKNERSSDGNGEEKKTDNNSNSETQKN